MDPLVELMQENTSPYGYVLGNPIKLTDPKGRNPIMGAVLSAFTEYAGIVGSRMIFEDMSFTEANKAMTWSDGLDITVAAGFGTASGAIDGGITKFASWASKPSNRKILTKLLEVGVSALEGSIKQLYKDEDFDLKSVMAGALAEVGLSSLLKTDVFKDAAETAGNNARVVSRRAEDLASRRSPNSRLVGKAKAAARAAEKKAKGLRSLDNTGKAIKGTIAKTTANKAQNEAKKDE